MYLLGIDLETTGLDPSSSDIIEIGYMVWDSSLSCSVECASYLIKYDKTLPEDIKKLTGITEEHLNHFGIELKQALSVLVDKAKKCDFFVGHNAIAFDRKILTQACQRLFIEFPKIKWIDTMIDLPYPDSITTRKLTYLAVEHNVFCGTAHRAVFDIGLTMQILSKYDMNEIIKRAETGFVKLIAEISYDERDKAKAKGFKWDSENKIWFKIVRAYDAKKIQFDFPVSAEVIANTAVKGC